MLMINRLVLVPQAGGNMVYIIDPYGLRQTETGLTRGLISSISRWQFLWISFLKGMFLEESKTDWPGRKTKVGVHLGSVSHLFCLAFVNVMLNRGDCYFTLQGTKQWRLVALRYFQRRKTCSREYPWNAHTPSKTTGRSRRKGWMRQHAEGQLPGPDSSVQSGHWSKVGNQKIRIFVPPKLYRTQ